MEFLKIDGAFGEGGGQIIRTATALSCIAKKPIIIENIRKGRKSPGLKAQHLTAVKILQKICNAEVKGASLNSTELSFVPGDMQDCRLEEDVGTAGSVSLILQSVIPAMAASGKEFGLKVTGGTDVPWSPTFDYLQNVLKEAFGRMGLDFSLRLNRRGYYPRGGGQVTVRASPQKIGPVRLVQRSTNAIKIKCSYSKIPEKVIEGKIGRIAKSLAQRGYGVESQIREEEASDSGAAVLAHTGDEESVIGTDALFDKKTCSFDLDLDKIAGNCLGVDENLADMIVLPASIACGMTVFCVPRITKHLETNLFVASKISGCRYGIGRLKDGFEVRIEGSSDAGIHQ